VERNLKSGNWWFISAVALLIPVVTHSQEYTFGSTYTTEQAESGQSLYAEHCAACHGAGLEGGIAAPLVGETFRITWSRPNVTVDDLHFIISTTMPVLQGGILSED
jgi:mono/diheme cytochrome c family protein